LTEQQATYDTDNGRQASVMPIADAARALGVSERTIWRRVKSGKLQTIDMNGKTCVQVTTAAQPVTQPAEDGTLTGGTSQNVQVFTDELKQQYRERITYLEGENSRLWSEIHAKQSTIDSLMPMLPAPAQSTEGQDVVPRGTRAGSIFWRVFAVLTIAAALAVLMLWIFFPPKRQAQPIKHVPTVRKVKTLQAWTHPAKTSGCTAKNCDAG
jgi:hypothetical protein